MHFANNQSAKDSFCIVPKPCNETTEKEVSMGMRNYFSRLNVVYRKSVLFPTNRRVIAERFPVKNRSALWMKSSVLIILVSQPRPGATHEMSCKSDDFLGVMGGGRCLPKSGLIISITNIMLLCFLPMKSRF